MKVCPNCLKPISEKKKRNKFCCQSCAASYNNRLRPPPSKEQRNKTSEKLSGRKNLSAQKKYCFVSFCVICRKTIKHKRNKTCSKTCLKKLQSQIANIKQFGGHTSKKSIYYKSQNNLVYLQSSYEIQVAQSLDYYKISWIRPKPFIWYDQENIKHRYYPDFYLPDYNIYLDPKNNYLIKKDQFKIQSVMKQNKIKIIILNEKQLDFKLFKHLL